MRVMLLVATLSTFGSACGGSGGGAGARCITSEECAAGLLCDTTQTPSVCSDKLGNRADGATSPTDQGVVAGADLSAAVQDLGGADLSAVEKDMTVVALHDLATNKD